MKPVKALLAEHLGSELVRASRKYLKVLERLNYQTEVAVVVREKSSANFSIQSGLEDKCPLKLITTTLQYISSNCEHTPVSFPSVGDPHLLPINNILVAHFYGSCFDASHVRSCPGLSDTVRLQKPTQELK